MYHLSWFWLCTSASSCRLFKWNWCHSNLQEHHSALWKTLVLESFFQHFSCINVHDHLRHESLKLEESWKTRNWWHRIFATVLGVIVTDCYYAYKMTMTRSHLAAVPFANFIEMLAHQLIFNTYLAHTRPQMASMDEVKVTPHYQLHQLSKLSYYEALKGKPKVRAKRRCVCHELTSYYCIHCSNISDAQDPNLSVCVQ